MIGNTRLSIVRAAAVGLTVVLGATLLPAQAATAKPPRVAREFFGMHDGNPLSWPDAPVGSVRLWDSGVSWREIEVRRGAFDFRRLDAIVDTARSRGARVLLVLGQTPRFHSTNPGRLGSYGKGAADMPRLGAWRAYVSKVVRRYDGRGVDYQVWNEANVAGYWRGTTAQMARLTKVTKKIVDRYDRWAKVVSPSLATRLTGQRLWLRKFWGERVGGKPVVKFVDAVGLHLYPMPRQQPEASMKLLSAVRTQLRGLGVGKPVWNTEINYGLLGGGTAKNIGRRKEAAYVARTYLLNAANDVKRVHWYSWDLGQLANTQMTYDNGTSLAPAGRAYVTVAEWMSKARIRGCDRDRRGTYTCEMTYPGGTKRVYWNPKRKVTIRAVPSATRWVSVTGGQHRITGGEAIGVKFSPIMVRSRR
jgi:hypothetical protein